MVCASGRMEGNAEKMRVDFIIRDFNTAKLHAYEEYLKDKATYAMRNFPAVDLNSK